MCEVEVARNIGADYLISGKIVQVQNMYVLHLKLHESSRGLLAGEQAQKMTSQKCWIQPSQVVVL